MRIVDVQRKHGQEKGYLIDSHGPIIVPVLLRLPPKNLHIILVSRLDLQLIGKISSDPDLIQIVVEEIVIAAD